MKRALHFLNNLHATRPALHDCLCAIVCIICFIVLVGIMIVFSP
jgi:hypothetical protein